jgi:beta-xylosidase
MKKIVGLFISLLAINNTFAQLIELPNGNPIIKNKYTADPAALVHNGKMYIYSGHDEAPEREQRYVMNEWLVFSSSDLKTWTEHPVPLKVTDFKWAKADAWASQVIEHNGKFYWYTAVEHGTIPGKAIGVAIADNPLGPFKDAKGSALITNDMTKGATIGWDDIDPSVFIDTDGQAYLFWGNTACYYAKLKPNMIELDGEIKQVQLPTKFTEAPYIHKRNNTYFLSYSIDFPEKTVYATSKSIHGPWKFERLICENAGNSNTNHHAIVDFKGQSYFVYHNGALSPDAASFHRSVCIDKLFYDKNGKIVPIVMTSAGLK